MKSIMKVIQIGIVSISAMLFSTCEKNPWAEFHEKNIKPVADAGADQTIVLPADSALLTGIGSDPDGIVIKSVWRIRAYYSQLGQEVFITHESTSAKLKGLKEGTYWCEFIVSDNGYLSAKDEMVISVVSAGCPCFPHPCDAFGDPCNPWDD